MIHSRDRSFKKIMTSSPTTMLSGGAGYQSAEVNVAQNGDGQCSAHEMEIQSEMIFSRRRRRKDAGLDNDGQDSITALPSSSESSRRIPIRGIINPRPKMIMARPVITLICSFAIFSGVAFGWSPSPASLLQQRSIQSSHDSLQLPMISHGSTRINPSSSTQIEMSTPSSSSASSTGTKESNIPLPPILNTLNEQTDLLSQCLQAESSKDFESLSSQPIWILKGMMSAYTNWIWTDDPSPRHKFQASALIDKAFRLVTNEAFSTPYRLGLVNLGLESMQLQLHPEELHRNLSMKGDSEINGAGSTNGAKLASLHPAYATLPKGTWLKALRALTSKDLKYSRSSSTRSVITISPTRNEKNQWITPSNAAFRILQRLVSGKGVRIFRKKKLGPQEEQPKLSLDERDFNMVLHSFATPPNSQLYSAHRVMALQERTPHAPPLSPVAYSILVKAYGRIKDVKNVEMSIQHAQRNGVVPDIVMVNTVLDAYVECGMLDRAQGVMYSISNEGEEEDYWPLLRANSRTYNTLMKGMAEEGDIQGAMKLSKEVQRKGLWDEITTNTLVKAAVTANDFSTAETILSNHTSAKSSPQTSRRRKADHPNVEAYTELLDGYAKDGQLESALRVMQVMQKRGVTPNEYTYTCIVGALARNNKLRQARKMISYAASLPEYKGRRRVALTPTYNAFISGLLSESSNAESSGQQSSHASHIVEVLSVLQEMQESNIHPNVVTVALVVDGLGKCSPPRVREASDLVQHLEYNYRMERTRNGYRGMENGKDISLSNNKIATALIQAYGRTDAVEMAVQSFDRILPQPDVVAFNALLDACCRNDRLKLALELFKKHASFKLWKKQPESTSKTIIKPSSGDKWDVLIKPDVVTYTTLISALLQLKSRAATTRAIELYDEMKQKRCVTPDTVLVDTILMIMTSGEPIGFEKSDIKFTLLVLRDGAHLDWERKGQYEKRKRAVRGILAGCPSKIWKNDEFAHGLMTEEEPDDPLFTKKGWNRIDSGFQLWGGDDNDWQQQGDEDDDSSVDSFLASKGWNDIDSGFRLL